MARKRKEYGNGSAKMSGSFDVLSGILDGPQTDREKTEAMLDAFVEADLAAAIKNEFAGTDYYTAPASIRFHDNEEGGLAKHSLAVVANLLKLKDVFKLAAKDVVLAGLLHDLCKINMYEADTHPVTGKRRWKIRDDYRAVGHGSESMRRALKLGVRGDFLLEAIAFHMGAFDFSKYEEINFHQALGGNPLILALITADMMTLVELG
jgi:hypothetical protein